VRTLVDLVPSQVVALDRLAKRRERSRAALIREAVDDYLLRNGGAAQVGDEAFGLWGNGLDGLAYEDKVRGEW
jgi:hypothetical protein